MSAVECPEMAVVAAVVAQAVRDVGDKKARDSALRWINSPDRRVFGFVWCAELLGLDAGWARARILERKHSLTKTR